ncbi:EAL domain-containing protein [Chthonobacter albigriseus]|uniref:EAL domain-containing protein n=1 Tax=Chthonobacter albigriseus TaxID=1683161 RepID=UPI0015EE8052|nr:EAL domain-containing protein [Chthonobacter albigriseus]
MARFVSVFVSEYRQRLVSTLVWCLAFAGSLLLFTAIGLQAASQAMRAGADNNLAEVVRLRTNAIAAFDMLEREVTAEPCSPDFQAQLRRIAFLPDGLNEFLYAPQGVARCSTSLPTFPTPVPLDRLDASEDGLKGSGMWLDLPLDFIGLPGLTGTILARGDFAVVIPSIQLKPPLLPWYAMEAVTFTDEGDTRHRSGTEELHEHLLSNLGWSALAEGHLHELVCEETGRECIAVDAHLSDIVRYNVAPIATAVLFALLLASWLQRFASDALQRYWSFEARFRRHLNADSVVCAYQPIMETATGRITACEVLARWRDLDDRLVFPDRFIPLVEANGLTLTFTDLLVRRAFTELDALVPPGDVLQVNFNVFPCDLDPEVLILLFEPFLAQRDRFVVAVEIVESDALVPDKAEVAIRALREAGIRVYIDDFGSGYSTVETLVALPVDGVKLDKGFAMAPDQTVMAQMMSFALEMIRASGRPVIVEGVETAHRLEQLKTFPFPIQHIQGYHVSRPVDAVSFVKQYVSANQTARKSMAAA